MNAAFQLCSPRRTRKCTALTCVLSALSGVAGGKFLICYSIFGSVRHVCATHLHTHVRNCSGRFTRAGYDVVVLTFVITFFLLLLGRGSGGVEG